MSSTSSSHSLLVANRWVVAIFTVLMVITAALAGNGIFKSGTMEWLITGHQHIGNLLFAMGVIQMILSYLLFTRNAISGSTMIISALVFLFTFGQIGLGYSTRSHMVDLVGWHIALGVALTAAVAMLTTMLWQPARTQNS